MDNTGCVLLLTERLEHHVVALRLLVLDEVISGARALGLHHKRVSRLADLTLEGLPEEGGEVRGDFLLLARLQPC